MADEVPAPAIGDDTPRLDRADGVRLAARRPVRKLHGLTGIDGGQQDSQHLLGTADARHPRRRRDGDAYVTGVDVHTGGPQLEQRALGRGDQLRRLPQLCRHRHGGGFVGGQVDGRQRVGVAVDAVALGRVELRYPAGFQRDAEVAQFVLVALEHPRERLVAGAVRVAVHGLPDPLGADVGAGGQQRDDEVHQPLDFGDPHGCTA